MCTKQENVGLKSAVECFQIKSVFKSRAGYNGTIMVYQIFSDCLTAYPKSNWRIQFSCTEFNPACHFSYFQGSYMNIQQAPKTVEKVEKCQRVHFGYLQIAIQNEKHMFVYKEGVRAIYLQGIFANFILLRISLLPFFKTFQVFS